VPPFGEAVGETGRESRRLHLGRERRELGARVAVLVDEDEVLHGRAFQSAARSVRSVHPLVGTMSRFSTFSEQQPLAKRNGGLEERVQTGHRLAQLFEELRRHRADKGRPCEQP
jgi:hypothetical protein